MDITQTQLIQADQQLQFFELLTPQIITTMENNQTIREQMNQEIRTLSHTCKYQQFDGQSNGYLKILIITWNLQGTLPAHSLKKLFHANEISHQLIVVGTQECQRSIGLSLFCESKQAWESKVQTELGKSFIKVHSITLNALSLIVFAHQNIPRSYEFIKSFTLPLGFLNIVGNKGAIGIAIKVGVRSFLFVCSHLQSGQQDNQKRQEQFSKISSQILVSKILKTETRIIDEFDYVFFMGDFNSRIDENLDQHKMSQINFFDCLRKDQKSLSNLASEFNEGMILFPPTYKLQPGKNQYGLGKEWRIPGWTDRIIFKTNKHSFVKQLEENINLKQHRKGQIVNIIGEENYEENELQLHNYDANFEIFGSDHRPVFAQFQALL